MISIADLYCLLCSSRINADGIQSIYLNFREFDQVYLNFANVFQIQPRNGIQGLVLFSIICSIRFEKAVYVYTIFHWNKICFFDQKATVDSHGVFGKVN